MTPLATPHHTLTSSVHGSTAADPGSITIDLADTIERFGVGAVPAADLLDLAIAGRAVGVIPEVADLLVDPTAPEPVRQRAYGYVALRVARRTAA